MQPIYHESKLAAISNCAHTVQLLGHLFGNEAPMNPELVIFADEARYALCRLLNACFATGLPEVMNIPVEESAPNFSYSNEELLDIAEDMNRTSGSSLNREPKEDQS